MILFFAVVSVKENRELFFGQRARRRERHGHNRAVIAWLRLFQKLFDRCPILDTENSWGGVGYSVGMSASPSQAGTPRKIVDYHLDEHLDWVADLECGHQQHVRHNPPWTNRHWVTTPQGRYEHLGYELPCLVCLTVATSTESF